MFDFTKLWDKRYLLGPNPLELARSDHIFLGLAIALVALGVGAKIMVWRADAGSPKKYLLGRLFHLFFTIGIGLGIWYGARIERIPWIYTHFTALFLLLIGAAWFVFIARYYVRVYRLAQRAWEDEKLKNKYLKK